MKKLSIITVCYNNLEGLLRTCNSVVEQTVRSQFEWIVIDGASTDGTPKWLTEHDAEIDRWISEPDTGIYNAMNKGVRIASGDYMLFLNSGDELNGADIVAKCLPYFDGSTDFIYGDEIHFNPKANESIRPWLPSHSFRPSDFIYHTLLHQATFIKRNSKSFYREDVGYLADWVFFMESVIQHDATMKRIPLTVSVFWLDGVSTIKADSWGDDRKKIFCQLFSESLYEDLKQLYEIRRLPFFSVIEWASKIRNFLSKIKRSILK